MSASLSQNGRFLNHTQTAKISQSQPCCIILTIFNKYLWYGCILYTPEVPALWKNEAQWRKTFPPPTQPSRAPFQHNVMFGFASISWTQGRFSWRFKMHFHHLLWKVSLCPQTTRLKGLPRLLPRWFPSINNGTEGTFACQYRNAFLENWVRMRQNFSTWKWKICTYDYSSTSEAWTDWIAWVFKLEAKDIIFGDAQIRKFQLALRSLLS